MSCLLNKKFTSFVKKLSIIEIVLIQICLFYCFCYGDIFITTNHGIVLLDCLYEGKIGSFYDVGIAVVNGQKYKAYYDFFIYIIFAIWNLPLWLAKKSGLIDDPLNYLLGIMWAKTIVLFFCVICLYYMWKVLSLKERYSKYNLVLVFSTDILITAFICIIGQYDIIVLSFMMAGLYYYLSGRKKMFIFAFAIAMSIKLFALLLFCPLLLQKEKNFLKIILNIMIVLIPIFIFRLLVPMGQSNSSLLIGLFLDNSFSANNGKISICIAAYIFFLLYCYIHNFKDQLYSSIVTPVFVFVIFFLLGNPLPYWWVYVSPFIVLIILLNKNSNVILQLVSIVGELMLYLYLMRIYYWVFSPYNIMNGVLRNVISVKGNYTSGPVNMYSAFFSRTSINQDSMLEILCSLAFICICSFIVLCQNKRVVSNKLINIRSNVIFVWSLRLISIVIAYFLMFFQLKYI